MAGSPAPLPLSADSSPAGSPAALAAALQAQGRVLLPVVVQPARRENALVGVLPDGTWKVAVAAPAREGEANAELCTFIRDSIPLRPLQVAVHRGHRSRQKLLLLTHAS